MDRIEVDVNELPGRFAELMAKAAAGEEIIVTEHGRPSATLAPVTQNSAPALPTRQLGLGADRGPYWMAPDFDAPLPDNFWFGESQ